LHSSYFLRKVDELQEIVNEIRAFFQGASDTDVASPTKQYYDEKDKCYVVPDGMDPDFLLNKIINGERLNAVDDLAVCEEGGAPVKEGSLSKRSDGRWMGRFYRGGVQRSVYAPTKAECVKKLQDAIAEYDKTEKASVSVKKMRLEAWANEWFKGKQLRLKPSSAANIDYAFLRPIQRHAIGKKEVCKITPMDVERFLNEIPTKAARARCFVNLNECLEKLFRQRVIKENPCALVDRPKRPKAKIKFVPETDDLDKFFDWLDVKNALVALFARFVANTGLRMGEALAVEWADVDEELNRIHIDKAFDQTTKKVSTVKTVSGVRDVPLIPGAMRVLTQIKKTAKAIFHEVNPLTISGRFRKLALEFGMDGLNLHGLRHYFATLCNEAGIDKKIVQTWLGHSKYDVTVNTYTHVRRKFEQLEIRKMAEFTRKDDDENDT
jgi:integrase